MAIQRIYALDDEPEITSLLERLCRSLGLEARTFNRIDDFKALDEFTNQSIILLDLSLGEGDGLDVIRFLAERGCQAVIFVMSGADERLLSTVQRLGVANGLDIRGILPKPFGLADLRACIEAAGPS